MAESQRSARSVDASKRQRDREIGKEREVEDREVGDREVERERGVREREKRGDFCLINSTGTNSS